MSKSHYGLGHIYVDKAIHTEIRVLCEFYQVTMTELMYDLMAAYRQTEEYRWCEQNCDRPKSGRVAEQRELWRRKHYARQQRNGKTSMARVLPEHGESSLAEVGRRLNASRLCDSGTEQ